MHIKDYLHLYLGCRLKIGEGSWADNAPHTFSAHLRSIEMDNGLPIKLVLRPLSDMTEEEEKEVTATKAFQRPSPVHHIGMMVWTAESFKLLLSKGFDLFGLIDAGLAIDKTKL